MTDKSEILVVVGSVASLALLIIYLKSAESSGVKVEPTFQVSSIDPTVAALKSQENIAGIGANRDVALGWLQLMGLNKTADTQLAIDKLDTARDVSVATVQGSTATTLGGYERDASIAASNYQYQSVVAAAKSKNKSDLYTMIGNIGKGIIGLFSK